jgi:hypothetical protein
LSKIVRLRLDKLNLTALTDHELRVELDGELERIYKGHCDMVIEKVSDEELRALVYALLKKRRRWRNPQQAEQEEKRVEQIYA